MKASIVLMTPIMAKSLLKSNKANRKVKPNAVAFYSSQMKLGDWKENGEAIIIDVNGVIKDGQHRLKACIEADYSWRCPIIEGVNPDVMATIDTGMNRSLSDILELEGFKNYASLAALVSRISKESKGSKTLTSGNLQGSIKDSNTVLAEYARNNYGMLSEVVGHGMGIYHKSTRVFNSTELSFVLYLISEKGTNINPYNLKFIKLLAGNSRIEGNSVDYVYKVKDKAKRSKTPLSGVWLMALIVKAWNNYLNGDPVINYLKHDLRNDFPKIEYMVKGVHVEKILEND